jgi:hypothetical protein
MVSTRAGDKAAPVEIEHGWQAALRVGRDIKVDFDIDVIGAKIGCSDRSGHEYSFSDGRISSAEGEEGEEGRSPYELSENRNGSDQRAKNPRLSATSKPPTDSTAIVALQLQDRANSKVRSRFELEYWSTGET